MHKRTRKTPGTVLVLVAIIALGTVKYARVADTERVELELAASLSDAERVLQDAMRKVKEACVTGTGKRGRSDREQPSKVLVQASEEWAHVVDMYRNTLQELEAPQPLPRPRFQATEFMCYSQTTEDGILLDIFSKIGTVNKKAVEVCSGTGFENNVANLAVLHGWETIMMDGNAGNVRAAKRFFGQPGMPNTLRQPHLVEAFITAENINELVAGEGFSGEIDLFSLDIDGMDWWIWHALTVVKPRVVVVEIQELWGPTESKTRGYNPAFQETGIPSMGASLGAFMKLAHARGYRLVGCMQLGFNAFFIREGVGVRAFPEYPPEGCFVHHTGAWARIIAQRKQQAQQYDWIDPVVTIY